jgi:uncharacterized protein with ParB-like and HNH nuclease domain
MIKSAQNKPVSELLSVDSNWRFRVPRYQREYVWRRDDWANLFDDLSENPPGYFLGSMICINRSDDSMQLQELEVIDGQQRLTTLSLLTRPYTPAFRSASWTKMRSTNCSTSVIA